VREARRAEARSDCAYRKFRLALKSFAKDHVTMLHASSSPAISFWRTTSNDVGLFAITSNKMRSRQFTGEELQVKFSGDERKMRKVPPVFPSLTP
jgi:hypothetical protein